MAQNVAALVQARAEDVTERIGEGQLEASRLAQPETERGARSGRISR